MYNYKFGIVSFHGVLRGSLCYTGNIRNRVLKKVNRTQSGSTRVNTGLGAVTVSGKSSNVLAV
jgi:hypothetical protein